MSVNLYNVYKKKSVLQISLSTDAYYYFRRFTRFSFVLQNCKVKGSNRRLMKGETSTLKCQIEKVYGPIKLQNAPQSAANINKPLFQMSRNLFFFLLNLHNSNIFRWSWPRRGCQSRIPNYGEANGKIRGRFVVI